MTMATAYASNWFSNYRDQAHIKKRRLQRKNAAWWIEPLLWAGVLFTACTGGFMVYSAFPWITGFGVAGLIGAGFVVDLLVYRPNGIRSAKTFFGSGMYNDLDDALRIQAVSEYLAKHPIKNLSKQKGAQALLNHLIKKYCNKNNLEPSDLKHEDKHKIEHEFRHKFAKILARQHKLWCKNPAAIKDTDMLKIIKAYHAETFKSEAAFHQKYAKKWGIKKSYWLTSAFIGAFANGFAFFAIVAAENLEFFAIASLATPAGAGIIAAATIVGLMQGLLFYHTLKKTIIKGFWEKLKSKLEFKRVNDGDTEWSLLASIPKNLLKWTIALAIVPLSIVSLCLTQSTILNSSLTLIEMTADLYRHLAWTSQAQIFLNAAIQVLMFGILLPTSFIFTVKHTVGACDKLANSISSGLDWIAHASVKDLLSRPDKTIFYGLIYTGITVGLIIHTSSEAMMEAGQGVFKPSKIIGPVGFVITFFINTCNRLHLSPSKAAAATQMIQETAEHGDFVWKNGNWLVQSLMNVSTPSIEKLSFKSDAPKIVADYNDFEEYIPTTACAA